MEQIDGFLFTGDHIILYKYVSTSPVAVCNGRGSVAFVYCTGAQKWPIVSLLRDVTSPTTVAYYVSITCCEHREALTAAPTTDCVHLQAIRVQG